MRLPPVMIVDDSIDCADMMATLLELKGLTSRICCDRETALEVLSNARFGLVLLNLRMPGMTPEDFVKAARANSRSPIVLVSAELESRHHAHTLGVDTFLQKPFSNNNFYSMVETFYNRISSQTNSNHSDSNGECIPDSSRQFKRPEQVISHAQTIAAREFWLHS